MIEDSEKFVRQIFPITLYQIPIENNQSLKEKYVSKIQQSYNFCPTDAPSFWETNKLHTSYHTPDLNDLVFEKQFPEEMYLSHISKVFDRPWKGYISEYWFNCYQDGEFQGKHHHCGSSSIDNPSFSCIHFLQFDSKRHVSPIFYDPMESLKSSYINVKKWSSDFYVSPIVNEGDLLVFPSYLEHSVRESYPTPNYPRITFSFNLKILEY